MRPPRRVHSAPAYGVAVALATLVASASSSCAGGSKGAGGSGGLSTTTSTSGTSLGSTSASSTSSGTGGTGGTSSTSSTSSASSTSASSTSGTTTSSSMLTTSCPTNTSTSCSTSASSSTSTSSTSSSSGATACTSGSQCNGGACLCGLCSAPTVLLLGGSPAGNLLAGTFRAASGWATTSLADTASFGPTLSTDTNGCGVGVYASATAGNQVAATIWSSGVWGAPAVVNASAVTRSTPYVDATGTSTSSVVYQDPTNHYWYLAYTGSWSSPQAVAPSGNQERGPFAAAIAVQMGHPAVAFFDGDPTMTSPVDTVTTTNLAGSAWAKPVTSCTGTAPNIVGNGSNDVIPPAIVSLTGGTQQVLIYAGNDNAITVLERHGTTFWLPPVVLPDAKTDTPVGLAPLASSTAILAFRGQDGYLYWSIYAGLCETWTPVAPFSSPNVTVDANTSPAVTHGIGGDTAEIAYISGGQAYHASLTGSTWSAPVLVGGSGLTGVAIAAAP